ncbi:MAG: nucleotidyltransferase family protein [Candidatus Omnitrophica bacterium]|nr:nucleotidyltransferase family protein [Candidatus Omnitrophota bacterium]MBU4487439.1 nucleotidyltransferase family protein [Candidatus Omnitrophota bacterium]MCG2705074.1 nucleotidyltransferase family protein [Candidatus Omnitrophota bacterium]
MFFYEEILREFQKQKVKYVLVGGMAFNLLGGLRNTADMDILVAMTDNNLTKVVNILKKKGYKVKQPVDPIGIADKKLREDWIKNKHMKAFNFYKEDEFKEVDILIDSPVSFEKAKKTAICVKGDNIIVPVVSIDNLIKMKTASGRNIDMVDVEELKKIKRLRAMK